jgi:hypothetical protein
MSGLRSTISAIIDGYDTVFTLSGTTSANYLSQLAGAVKQDIAFVNIPVPDPNAPSLLQTMMLSVVSSTGRSGVINISQQFYFNPEQFMQINARGGCCRGCASTSTDRVACLPHNASGGCCRGCASASTDRLACLPHSCQ